MPGRRCAVALVLLALLFSADRLAPGGARLPWHRRGRPHLRASSVARGHWEAGKRHPRQTAAAISSRSQKTSSRRHERPAPRSNTSGRTTAPPTTRPDGSGEVRIASAAATYNPTWYMVVGSAGLPFDGQNAAVAMRLCAALLCDLLIAVALWLLVTRTASRWASIGVAVACTPVLVYSTVNAAPNGARILRRLAALGLAVDPAARRNRKCERSASSALPLVRQPSWRLTRPGCSGCSCPSGAPAP